MKKVWILALVILMTTVTAAFGLDLVVGAKAGAGVGFLTGDDWTAALDVVDADNDVRLGLNGVAFLGLEFGDFLVVEPAITYTLTGGAYTIGDATGTVTANLLTVPVYLRPSFAMGRGDLYLFAGPELYVILGDLEQEEALEGVTVGIDLTPDNRMLFGLSGGVGYSFPLGPGRALVEAKYSRSLTEIFNDDDTALNSAFLQLGYSFPLFVF